MNTGTQSITAPTGFRSVGWGIALLLSGVLLLLVLLPPFVPEPARSLLMLLFKPFCHQMPGRSFHIHGHQLAVCHRCLGIYAGLFTGALLFGYVRRWDAFLMRRSAPILCVAIAIPGIDWLLGFTGIWANTTFTQTATGAIFGLAAGYYLARACARPTLNSAHTQTQPATSRPHHP